MTRKYCTLTVMVKFEMRIVGLSSMMVCWVEDEDELMDHIDSAQWLHVENRAGDPIWVNSDHVAAFWEAEIE